MHFLPKLLEKFQYLSCKQIRHVVAMRDKVGSEFET